MAILEKEVIIVLNSSTQKYYVELGYEIPKKKDKKGKLVVPMNTKIKVKVKDLSKRSKVKVTRICDECGKIKVVPYYKIATSREEGDGNDRCLSCAGLKTWEIRYKNVNHERSLEWYAKENNKEYLLIEFSDKNKKRPKEIYRGSRELIYWKCLSCENEYEMTANKRTNGRNCPYCAGIKVNETNCLWSTHPEIAKLLTNPKLGYEITSGCNSKLSFTCPDCGNVEEKIIGNLTKKERRFSCSVCSDSISYPEKFISSILDQLGINYLKHKTFKWSDRKIYDFYIPSLKMIIETHGFQHYRGGFEKIGGRTLEEEQENDKFKKEMAMQNGISNYIVLDCRLSDFKYIKKSIKNSDLSNFFNLNEINWVKAHEYSLNSSIIKIICSQWNSGNAIEEICKNVKLNKFAIIKYLKQGDILGWCEYKYNGVPVNSKVTIQLSMDGEYIREFKSTAEAGRELGINPNNIRKVCSGLRKSSRGFKWKYKD